MNTVFDVQDVDTPNKKQVFIVCEKGQKELAECFMTLISAESDIQATMMLYNEYEGTRPSFSSENYVIFLGNYPEKKGFMRQLNLKDESAEYGIFIGRQGRVALIQVDLEYLEILKNKNKYEKYVRSTEKSLRKILVGAALIPLVGVLAPIGWYVLSYWERRKLIKQLYACAISEYYEKYLKSF